MMTLDKTVSERMIYMKKLSSARRTLAMLLCAALLAASAAVLTGCSDANNFPVTVAGVTLYQRPQKIVCLSNKYTEILVDMGYADKLSGRPGDCELAAVQDIAPCGTAAEPAIEQILGLGCDLLICDTDPAEEKLLDIGSHGIPIIQLMTPATRTGFSILYRCLGAAVDGAVDGYNTGNDAAQKILVQLDDVERAVMDVNSLNVCIFTNDALTSCISGDCLGNVLIEQAGGFNVAVERTGGTVDLEKIALSDPDVIICTAGGEGEVRSQRILEKCEAVKNNKIFIYESDKFDSLGYDLVLCAWELARLLHPDVVTPDMLPNGAIDYYPTYEDAVVSGEEYLAYSSSVEEARNTTTFTGVTYYQPTEETTAATTAGGRR